MILFALIINAAFIKEPPPLGKLVDVGGFKLHIHTTGKGGPPVVLLAGSGNWSIHWSLVQPKVAEFAQVSSLDYQGLGWSEFGPPHRGLKQDAYEIRTLLREAGLEGPYLFVGQSLGGLIAQVFASSWPEDVAGIIFVDSSTPDLRLKFMKDGQGVWDLCRNRGRGEPVPPIQKRLLQKPELKSFPQNRDYGDLTMFPSHIQELFQWFAKKPFVFAKGQRNHMNDEMAEMHENKTAYQLGNLPITVISGDDPDRYKDDENGAERLKWHKEAVAYLMSLSTRATLVSASKSGHWVHVDEPQVVIDAVKNMANALNKKP